MIYIYLYASICIYICMYICIYVHVYTYTHMHTCMYISKYIFVPIHTHICVVSSHTCLRAVHVCLCVFAWVTCHNPTRISVPIIYRVSCSRQPHISCVILKSKKIIEKSKHLNKSAHYISSLLLAATSQQPSHFLFSTSTAPCVTNSIYDVTHMGHSLFKCDVTHSCVTTHVFVFNLWRALLSALECAWIHMRRDSLPFSRWCVYCLFLDVDVYDSLH